MNAMRTQLVQAQAQVIQANNDYGNNSSNWRGGGIKGGSSGTTIIIITIILTTAAGAVVDIKDTAVEEANEYIKETCVEVEHPTPTETAAIPSSTTTLQNPTTSWMISTRT